MAEAPPAAAPPIGRWSTLADRSKEGTSKRYGNDSPAAYDYVINVLTLGESGVGKTSLIQRYKFGEVQRTTMATIGLQSYTDTFGVGQYKIRLDLSDTGGQERFRAVTPQYMRGKHGMVLVFDVTSRQSFEQVNNWYSMAQHYYTEGKEPPVMLIGNKIDIIEKREVSHQEAKEYARAKNYWYYEMSALFGELESIQAPLRQFVAYCLASRVTQVQPNQVLPTPNESNMTDILKRVNQARNILGPEKASVVTTRRHEDPFVLPQQAHPASQSIDDSYEVDRVKPCAC